MRQPILSPDKFAEWFNQLVPGAYRSINTQDVRDMVECGLIGHSNYYGRQDIETVRGILLYEQLREQREHSKDKINKCKRCGESLTDKGNGKGRPREYCQLCEPFRSRDRYENWKVKHASVSSV